MYFAVWLIEICVFLIGTNVSASMNFKYRQISKTESCNEYYFTLQFKNESTLKWHFGG